MFCSCVLFEGVFWCLLLRFVVVACLKQRCRLFVRVFVCVVLYVFCVIWLVVDVYVLS